MSASLVGSEMCIRDRSTASPVASGSKPCAATGLGAKCSPRNRNIDPRPSLENGLDLLPALAVGVELVDELLGLVHELDGNVRGQGLVDLAAHLRERVMRCFEEALVLHGNRKPHRRSVLAVLGQGQA
eukprot:15430795-Alexandrium_andersonii.AAC.1